MAPARQPPCHCPCSAPRPARGRGGGAPLGLGLGLGRARRAELALASRACTPTIYGEPAQGLALPRNRAVEPVTHTRGREPWPSGWERRDVGTSCPDLPGCPPRPPAPHPTRAPQAQAPPGSGPLGRSGVCKGPSTQQALRLAGCWHCRPEPTSQRGCRSRGRGEQPSGDLAQPDMPAVTARTSRADRV